MTLRTAFPASRPATLRFLLLALVMIYGAVAGLRTVADFDLGWQMADARNPFAPGDTLSYTVPGAGWIYPPLAGIVFRRLFQIGQLFQIDGYAALSWFCAAALLATLAILAVKSGRITLLLLLIAVPALAAQMIPRSGLFTVVIAAAYSRVLLSHYLGKSRRWLWLLPGLMVFWVNLHTGFIAGLGLMLGYVVAAFVDSVRIAERERAIGRLRQAAPWMLASVLCTLLNPWGYRIYGAVIAQEHLSSLQSATILEVAPLYREFHWSSLHLAASLGAIWWVIACSLVSIALLLREKRFGLALFLALATIACLGSARTEGVFVPIACLLGGSVFEAYALRLQRFKVHTWYRLMVVFATVAVACMVAWRCVDTVTDRTSLEERQITLFGAGASWWLPQKAAMFVERNALPTELFAPFNLSSYLTWRLGPRYRDFADGRYLPFGDIAVSEQLRLASEPLDSAEWSRASAQYGIHTVMLPLSRFYGIEGVPLRADCESQNWVPVYLDATALVLVQKNALAQHELAALMVDCQKQQLVPAVDDRQSRYTRMEHYQMLANAAVIYFVLGRNRDAEQAVARAWQISKTDDSLMVLRGQLQAEEGDAAAAEQSFHNALAMRVSDTAWFQLGLLYATERRYPDAIHSFRQATALQGEPDFQTVWSLAKVELLNGDQAIALQTLEKASRLVSTSDPAGDAKHADVDDTRAVAYSQSANWPAAITAEQEAIERTPAIARRWQILAALYGAAGQQAQALRARQRADALAAQAH